MAPGDFADRVVRWQAAHGRGDLPWQGTRDPYRVWLSEIMLQQTQVATVIGYYERFLAHFPDVRALAAAGPDDVLALWSGLGYYSRARHLHSCAQMVAREHGGVFPESAAELQKLPGIGRSTAAAIAAFCFGERAAILDGNVRRVLTRVLGFGADLAQAANERALWKEAQQLLPQTDVRLAMPRYTQGLMDLARRCVLRRIRNASVARSRISAWRIARAIRGAIRCVRDKSSVVSKIGGCCCIWTTGDVAGLPRARHAASGRACTVRPCRCSLPVPMPGTRTRR